MYVVILGMCILGGDNDDGVDTLVFLRRFFHLITITTGNATACNRRNERCQRWPYQEYN